jgi:carbon storage regulator CsrA
MLVLSRQLHERIIMPSVGVTIEVVAVKPNTVRLGIDAPPEIVILREEVLHREGVLREDLLADTDTSAQSQLGQIKQVLQNRLTNVGLGLDLLRKQVRQSDDPSLDELLVRMSDEIARLDQQLRALLNGPKDNARNGALSLVEEPA